MTQEAPIHEKIKQYYLNQDERSTNLIFRKFRNTTRVAKNSISDLVVELSQNLIFNLKTFVLMCLVQKVVWL
jgi:nitronate monooxygenase